MLEGRRNFRERSNKSQVLFVLKFILLSRALKFLSYIVNGKKTCAFFPDKHWRSKES